MTEFYKLISKSKNFSISHELNSQVWIIEIDKQSIYLNAKEAGQVFGLLSETLSTTHKETYMQQ